MNEIYLMVTIVKRAAVSKLMSFFEESHSIVSMVTLGAGTVNSELLDYYGLEDFEKAVFFGVVTDPVWHTLKKGLRHRFQFDIPGFGIAFTIPLSSVGGKREFLFLTERQGYEKGEETTLKGTTDELLLVIANQGYSDLIMDAARSAGATGGTIIHAKGTGMERAEQFLGVSLASEKEMIFILTKSEIKQAIMQAIMTQAGLESKAKSILISLPVTNTLGLPSAEDE